MNSKTLNVLLILLCAAVVITAGYFFSTVESWDKKYLSTKKNPYDTFIMHELLFSKFNSKPNRDYKSITDSSLKEFYQSGLTYVCIGRQLFLDSADQASILTFVAQGNTAFISTDYLPHFLYDFQFTKDTTYTNSQNQDIFVDQFPTVESSELTVKLNDYKDTIVFPNVTNNQIIIDSHSYLESNYGLNERVNVLGRFNKNYINFFSYNYGKGKFLIHTTPEMFSNYALSKENNLAYAEFVFSHLETKNGIFWDEFNKAYHYKHKQQNNQIEQESPLRYILSQPALRYAWYLALGFLIVYMIFAGKRRQRPIPVLEKLQNTSLEFIKTVGKLYYSERDHRGICMHKMKLFNNFLRARYSINANTITDEIKERISLVSGVSQENVNKIYSGYFWIEKQIDLTDHELIEFASSINNFYKQCK